MSGDELRAVREDLGLKQGQMARQLGVTREYYNRLERGKGPITGTLLLLVGKLAGSRPTWGCDVA
jgi:transcriptional regulator with XRE-family HTH domain